MRLRRGIARHLCWPSFRALCGVPGPEPHLEFLLRPLIAGRLGLKQCEGVVEMRDAIGQRRTCQRLAAGQVKILHRLFSVAAAPIVMCQFLQMVI